MQKHYSSEKIKLLEETYNIIKDCNNELAVKLIDSLEKLNTAEEERVNLLLNKMNKFMTIIYCSLVFLFFLFILEVIQLSY